MATTSTTTTDIPLPSLGPNADRGEDISQPTHGYPKIARLMGENPDLAIFRSFRELNARNLLYYQAELVHLEDQLHHIEWDDSRSTDPMASRTSRDWFWMRASAETGEGGGQLETVLRIRSILKEYNEALLKQRELSRIPEPIGDNLKTLRYWLTHAAGGNFPLLGMDRNVWGDPFDLDQKPEFHDLVAPAAEPPNSSIVNLTLKLLLPLYHKLFGFRLNAKNDGTFINYSNTAIVQFSGAIATIYACLLPIASASALFAIESMWLRLGLIAALTAAASFSLIILTVASKREVIIISVAYSAIMIIFVGMLH